MLKLLGKKLLSNQALLSKRFMSSINNPLETIVRSTTASGSQVYESKRAVNEYLLFHYGKSQEIIPFDASLSPYLNFPQRCAKLSSIIYESHHHPTLDMRKSRALGVLCQNYHFIRES